MSPSAFASVSTAPPDISLNGAQLVPLLSGGLYWPDRQVLIVADLHLEKASSLARTGQFLPPYDSTECLTRLETDLDRLAPRSLIALGDSFHDGGGPARLPAPDAARLAAIARRFDLIWIIGNHDAHRPGANPADTPLTQWGGRVAETLTLGPLAFRHEAADGPHAGEVSGHFHPKAAIIQRGRRLSARCFVEDGRRIVLPAYGTFTGGLDARDPALTCLFPHGFTAHLLGRQRILPVPHHRLAPKG